PAVSAPEGHVDWRNNLLSLAEPYHLSEVQQVRSEMRHGEVLAKIPAPEEHVGTHSLQEKTLAVAGALGKVSRDRYMPILAQWSPTYRTKVVGIDLKSPEDADQIIGEQQLPMRVEDYYQGFELFKQAVERGEIKPDAILIATWPNTHLDYIRWAVERGIAAFVEKPLVTPDQIDELIALYERYPDLIFSIDHVIERGAMMEALNMNERLPELLGDLAGVEGRLYEEKSNAAWIVDSEISGGGQAMDTMVHIIAPLEMMLAPFGLSFEDLSLNAKDIVLARRTDAVPGAETYAHIRTELKGVPVDLEVGDGMPSNDRYCRLRGTKGDLEIYFKFPDGSNLIRYVPREGRGWEKRFSETEAGQANIVLKIYDQLHDLHYVSKEERDRRFWASVRAVRLIGQAYTKFDGKYATYEAGHLPDAPNRSEMRSDSNPEDVLLMLRDACDAKRAELSEIEDDSMRTRAAQLIETINQTGLRLYQYSKKITDEDYLGRFDRYEDFRDYVTRVILPLMNEYDVKTLAYVIRSESADELGALFEGMTSDADMIFGLPKLVWLHRLLNGLVQDMTKLRNLYVYVQSGWPFGFATPLEKAYDEKSKQKLRRAMALLTSSPLFNQYQDVLKGRYSLAFTNDYVETHSPVEIAAEFFTKAEAIRDQGDPRRLAVAEFQSHWTGEEVPPWVNPLKHMCLLQRMVVSNSFIADLMLRGELNADEVEALPARLRKWLESAEKTIRLIHTLHTEVLPREGWEWMRDMERMNQQIQESFARWRSEARLKSVGSKQSTVSSQSDRNVLPTASRLVPTEMRSETRLFKRLRDWIADAVSSVQQWFSPQTPVYPIREEGPKELVETIECGWFELIETINELALVREPLMMVALNVPSVIQLNYFPQSERSKTETSLILRRIGQYFVTQLERKPHFSGLAFTYRLDLNRTHVRQGSKEHDEYELSITARPFEESLDRSEMRQDASPETQRELEQALLAQNVRPLRNSIDLDELRSDLKHAALRIPGLTNSQQRELCGWIDESLKKPIVEFDAVVIPDPAERTKSQGDLLWFNTVPAAPVAAVTVPEFEFQELIAEKYPAAIGLSSEVLDLIGANASALNEYLFNVLFAPSMGEERAAELRKEIFDYNYRVPYGSKQPGGKYGDLDFALKYVADEKLAPPAAGIASRIPASIHEALKDVGFLQLLAEEAAQRTAARIGIPGMVIEARIAGSMRYFPGYDHDDWDIDFVIHYPQELRLRDSIAQRRVTSNAVPFFTAELRKALQACYPDLNIRADRLIRSGMVCALYDFRVEGALAPMQVRLHVTPWGDWQDMARIILGDLYRTDVQGLLTHLRDLVSDLSDPELQKHFVNRTFQKHFTYELVKVMYLLGTETMHAEVLRDIQTLPPIEILRKWKDAIEKYWTMLFQRTDAGVVERVAAKLREPIRSQTPSRSETRWDNKPMILPRLSGELEEMLSAQFDIYNQSVVSEKDHAYAPLRLELSAVPSFPEGDLASANQFLKSRAVRSFYEGISRMPQVLDRLHVPDRFVGLLPDAMVIGEYVFGHLTKMLKSPVHDRFFVQMICLAVASARLEVSNNVLSRFMDGSFGSEDQLLTFVQLNAPMILDQVFIAPMIEEMLFRYLIPRYMVSVQGMPLGHYDDGTDESALGFSNRLFADGHSAIMSEGDRTTPGIGLRHSWDHTLIAMTSSLLVAAGYHMAINFTATRLRSMGFGVLNAPRDVLSVIVDAERLMCQAAFWGATVDFSRTNQNMILHLQEARSEVRRGSRDEPPVDARNFTWDEAIGRWRHVKYSSLIVGTPDDIERARDHDSISEDSTMTQDVRIETNLGFGIYVFDAHDKSDSYLDDSTERGETQKVNDQLFIDAHTDAYIPDLKHGYGPGYIAITLAQKKRIGRHIHVSRTSRNVIDHGDENDEGIGMVKSHVSEYVHTGFDKYFDWKDRPRNQRIVINICSDVADAQSIIRFLDRLFKEDGIVPSTVHISTSPSAWYQDSTDEYGGPTSYGDVRICRDVAKFMVSEGAERVLRANIERLPPEQRNTAVRSEMRKADPASTTRSEVRVNDFSRFVMTKIFDPLFQERGVTEVAIRFQNGNELVIERETADPEDEHKLARTEEF
ncbi:MAG: Gfo/Idh/MocA family oxidoreductase, partial [Candidatus Omnitrophica bacterium]|nr:Gfo/Idh/MocA family oxidoreductase [Candidatus Omnitrophota bacterium]